MKTASHSDRYIFAAVQELALSNGKMAFISGPRQVGKTTFAKAPALQYGFRILSKHN